MAESLPKIGECGHTYQGEVDGALTCYKCGEVLQDRYCSGEIPPPPNREFEDNFSLTPFNEIIYDLKERGLISPEVLFSCERMIEKMKTTTKRLPQNYEIYVVLKCAREIDYPLLTIEICEYFQVQPSFLSRFEKQFGDIKPLHAINYLHRVCDCLKIPFKLQKKIKSSFLFASEVVLSKNNILIGACILYHCDFISVKDLSVIVFSPKNVLYKWAKKVRELCQKHM